jgi:hypothetical protein
MFTFTLDAPAPSGKAAAEPCDIARMIVARWAGDLDASDATFLIEISCSRGRLSAADRAWLDRLAKKVERCPAFDHGREAADTTV